MFPSPLIPAHESWKPSEEQRLRRIEQHRGCPSLRVVGSASAEEGWVEEQWNISTPKAFQEWITSFSDFKFVVKTDTEARLSRLESREKARDAEIAELKRVVSEMIGDNAPVRLGAFEVWRETKAADEFAGKHVAFLESKGEVIAAHESLGGLLSMLKDLDPKGEAVVGLVA